jgi:uncharacterized protein (DUF342 family)
MDERKKPRLFTAGSEPELLQAAEEWFGCPAAKLHRVDYRPELAIGRTAVFCPEQDWQNYSNMDAQAKLCYQPDGVYLALIPAQGSGRPLDRTRLTEYVARKSLNGLAEVSLKELISQGFGRGRIAPAQDEKILNEELRLFISVDEMNAGAVLLPRDPDGKQLTREELDKALKDKHVVFGVSDAALDQILTERPYYRHITVAKGTPYVNGTDGSVKFLFQNTHTGTPTIDPETGMADFHKLDWFTWVNQGDLLVTRTPSTAGESGTSVCGRTLTPKHGREMQMPRGVKVTYNADKTEMYAAVSGRVEYKNDLVQVSDVYEVPGNVDMTVGNIEFAGSVIVRGSVASRMKIRAAGEVTVCGGVQDAEIVAGGDVTIMNGLQGQGVGSVTTEGTLYVKFIEQGVVRAQNVVTDEIINSHVESSEDVIVVGKHGFISGGVIRARRTVAAQTIGTEHSPKTRVEVGIDPETSRRHLVVKKLLEEKGKTLEELKKAADYLLPRSETSEELKDKLRQVVTTKVQFMQEIRTLEREREDLEERLSNMGGGMVHVLDIIYPGALVVISGVVYPVTGTPTRNATFKLAGEEVTFLTCQYSAEEGRRRSRHRK